MMLRLNEEANTEVNLGFSLVQTYHAFMVRQGIRPDLPNQIWLICWGSRVADSLQESLCLFRFYKLSQKWGAQ